MLATALSSALPCKAPAEQPVSTDTFSVRATVEDHCLLSTSPLQLDGVCRYASPSSQGLVASDLANDPIGCDPGENCSPEAASGHPHHPRLSTGQFYIIIF